MVERSLCMREARGSIPRISILCFFLKGSHRDFLLHLLFCILGSDSVFSCLLEETYEGAKLIDTLEREIAEVYRLQRKEERC